jgi:two-component system, OmpR family, copper resistance phosphate regulon response regulator CusR
MIMRILIVEDDLQLGPALKTLLDQQHHATDWLTDGADGLSAALTTSYDLLIVDVLLPSLDGFTFCRELRAQQVTTPLLLLTALGDVHQRVKGLDAGADDYLGKPFDPAELVARVRALLRRGSPDKSPILQAGDLTLDTSTHEVRRAGQVILLTSKEYALLNYFMRYPGHVLSRAQLVDHVWDAAADHASNVLEVFIANLRRKLGEPHLIHTVRGSGYQLRLPENS